MSKYTPGPWEVVFDENEDGHVIRMGSALKADGSNTSHWQPQHYIVWAHGLYPEDGEQFQEAEANAYLMASVPEMVGILKALENNLCTCSLMVSTYMNPCLSCRARMLLNCFDDALAEEE